MRKRREPCLRASSAAPGFLERENAVAASNNSAGRLDGHRVARVFGSLEPAQVARAFQAVCSEIIGPCETGVFTFVPGERTQVQRFGEEAEPTAWRLFSGRGGVPVWGKADPIGGGPPNHDGDWRAHVPLSAEGEDIGILEVVLDRTAGIPEIAALEGLAGVLSVAVRNSQTFEKTRRLTFTDDLTDLYNSRFMRLYLDRELKRCRRSRASLSLLFLDLDGFKKINDTHGHLAGSRTLVEVGLVLEKTVRDADVLIRYGGDEFVILFPETPLAGGLIIAEKIRQAIGAARFLESQQIEARVSASIGIAAYPESAADVRSLISSADRAMYEAKSLGKNRVVAASPLPFPVSP